MDFKSEKHVKLLGVNVDTKLNFTFYTSEICQGARRQLNVLNLVAQMLHKKIATLHVIYVSFLLLSRCMVQKTNIVNLKKSNNVL